jgi:hypothetical protein
LRATLRRPFDPGRSHVVDSFVQAEEALGVAMHQLRRGVGVEAGGLDARDRRAVVEVEGIVGADQQLRGAEGGDQVAQRGASNTSVS